MYNDALHLNYLESIFIFTHSYINFYYSGKKYALHRLLYNNFIGILSDSEYIKFKCANKGICCNINHFYKINRDDNN